MMQGVAEYHCARQEAKRKLQKTKAKREEEDVDDDECAIPAAGGRIGYDDEHAEQRKEGCDGTQSDRDGPHDGMFVRVDGGHDAGK